jgi:hypothetical protein
MATTDPMERSLQRTSEFAHERTRYEYAGMADAISNAMEQYRAQRKSFEDSAAAAYALGTQELMRQKLQQEVQDYAQTLQLRTMQQQAMKVKLEREMMEFQVAQQRRRAFQEAHEMGLPEDVAMRGYPDPSSPSGYSRFVMGANRQMTPQHATEDQARLIESEMYPRATAISSREGIAAARLRAQSEDANARLLIAQGKMAMEADENKRKAMEHEVSLLKMMADLANNRMELQLKTRQLDLTARREDRAEIESMMRYRLAENELRMLDANRRYVEERITQAKNEGKAADEVTRIKQLLLLLDSAKQSGMLYYALDNQLGAEHAEVKTAFDRFSSQTELASQLVLQLFPSGR